MAGVGIEQAVRIFGRGADIAITVDDNESVAMLKLARRPQFRPGRRDVEGRFRRRFEVWRHQENCAVAGVSEVMG